MEAKFELLQHISQSELLAICLFWGYRAEDNLLDKDERIRCNANKERIWPLLTVTQQASYTRDLKSYSQHKSVNIVQALNSLEAFNKTFKKFKES